MLTTQRSVRYELDQLDYTVYRVSPRCFSFGRRKTCRKVLEIRFVGIPGYFRSDGSLHTVYSMILLRGEKKMKLVKTLGILLCFALLASTAVATPSKNSEMPTEDQFSAWINGFSGEDNFVSSAYNGYIEEFPKCHVDKIESNGEIVGIVFYTSDPSEGDEGYDSHYYDAKGDKMGIGCDGSFKLVDSYKGEGIQEKEEVTEEDEKEEAIDEVKTEKEVSHKKHKESAKDIGRNIIKKGMKDEGKKTYEDLGKALDKYKGDLDVKSVECANLLSEYLEEKGFKTAVEVRVKVTTGDEGDVYIIL